MSQSSSSKVITMIDIGLSANEHYIQFVPPATFGVIYDSSKNKVYLVRANGERTSLRRTADKIYALRGFIGLRRRENRELELGKTIEDVIIRHVLLSFESCEKLREAVWKFCPFAESAEVITDLWAPAALAKDIERNEESQPKSPTYDVSESINVSTPKGENWEHLHSTLVSSIPSSQSCGHSEERNSTRKEISEWPYMETSPGHLQDSFPTISPQELEQNIFLTAHTSSSPFTDHLIYSKLGPTYPTKGFQASNYTIPIAEDSVPRPQIPYTERVELAGHPVSSRDMSNEIFNASPHVPHFGVPMQQLTPTQFAHVPRAAAIGPFPSPPAPSPHRRTREESSFDPSETLPEKSPANNIQDLYLELRALVSLEVMRTRQLSHSVKAQMVFKLLSQFGLSCNNGNIMECHGKIDSVARDCIGRMQEYFLVEGMSHFRSKNGDNLTEYVLDDALPSHKCDACDECISKFFSWIQLSEIVNVSAVLTNSSSRECVANFYKYGVQLGVKAAWDKKFREQGFENCFYALDWLTINVVFPRKREHDDDGNYLQPREGHKRRKLDVVSIYPPLSI